MKTNKTFLRFIILFVITLLFSNNLLSQFVTYGSKKFKPARVTIEHLLVYEQPIPNLFSNISDYFSFKGYGVKYGFGTQVNIKLATDKKGKIRPYLSLAYSLFLGNDNSRGYIDSNVINYGFPLNKTYSGVPGTSKLYLHFITAGIGIEYAFLNKTRWIPYLGLEMDFNVLMGTYRQTLSGLAQTSFTIKPAVRFGAALGGGVQVRLSKAIGLVFSSKFKYANLIGKSSEFVQEQNKMKLLDKSAANLNSTLSKDRHIMYIDLMLGVAYYIGRAK
jgi:hypothetical protein